MKDMTDKSTDFLSGRIVEFSHKIGQKDIDAVLFSDPVSLRYFTGMKLFSRVYLILKTGNPSDRVAGNKNGSALIVPKLEFELASAKIGDLPIKVIASKERHDLRPGDFIRETISADSVHIGVRFGELTFSEMVKITGELEGNDKLDGNRRVEDVKLQTHKYTISDINKDLNEMRAVKYSDEIELLRKAGKITADVLGDIIKGLKPGKTEREIAAEIIYKILLSGGEDKSFEPIVASGPNSSYPHATVTDRIIEKGDTITIDMGAVYKGYHSDITRTFIVGDIPRDPIQSEIINLVNDTYREAFNRIEEGIKCSEVDAAARDFLKNADISPELRRIIGDDKTPADYFIHGLGHGVGLEVHDPIPVLNPTSDTILKKGMVFTVEPGIYIPEVGGARTENTILLGENGPEVLTPLEIKDFPAGG